MATRNEAAQRLTDIILEVIIKKDLLDSLDSERYQNYSKTIDSSTGTPTISSGQSSTQNILLHGQDYRQKGLNSVLIDKINQVVDSCLKKTTEALPDDPEGYFIPAEVDWCTDVESYCLGWNDGLGDPNNLNNTPHETYDYDPWIVFGPSEIIGENGGSMCQQMHSVNPLQITQEILYSLSQFLTFNLTKTNIDPELAKEVLDTNIYELIPTGLTRQQRIDKLFTEFVELVGPSPLAEVAGSFDLDVDDDSVLDTWYDLLTGQESWHSIWDIKPDIDPNVGNIVRLERHEHKTGQSLESMRNLIDDYLRDLDYFSSQEVGDTRPEREITGKGYLQIRHLNQSIIIRNEEDKDLGLIGEDPYNPEWINKGFTISMWVRFLTKSSEGTLFNFGNPTRSNLPYGFKLETFTVSKSEYDVDGIYDSSDLPINAFNQSDYSRFLRLVVNDGSLRDSHTGTLDLPRMDTTPGELAYESNPKMAYNYTQVPIDFNEWYYIVATYNPSIREDFSYNVEGVLNNESIEMNYQRKFWENHILVDNDNIAKYVGLSSMGTRCKVEIISKSDLNRAIGFKN